MSEELGECPNNTEDTVCLSYNCPYKHDRVWPIPPAIQDEKAFLHLITTEERKREAVALREKLFKERTMKRLEKNLKVVGSEA